MDNLNTDVSCPLEKKCHSLHLPCDRL